MKSQTALVSSSLITLIAPMIWGTTYLVTTEFLPPDTPLLAATLRALPAGLILLLISRKLPSGIWWWRVFILGSLNIGFFFYFLFLSAYHLPGGVAALIMSIQPIIVLFLGVIILREKISKLHLLASIGGITGVALLVISSKASVNNTGVIAGVLGALSMAIGILLTKHWGRPTDISIYTFTGWQLAIGGLILLPITLASETIPAELTSNNLLGFTYLCLIGALVAYIIWFRGLDKLPAITVSFLSLASPLTAAILGFIFLAESFSGFQLLGAFIIITSIILAQLKVA